MVEWVCHSLTMVVWVCHNLAMVEWVCHTLTMVEWVCHISTMFEWVCHTLTMVKWVWYSSTMIEWVCHTSTMIEWVCYNSNTSDAVNSWPPNFFKLDISTGVTGCGSWRGCTHFLKIRLLLTFYKIWTNQALSSLWRISIRVKCLWLILGLLHTIYICTDR